MADIFGPESPAGTDMARSQELAPERDHFARSFSYGKSTSRQSRAPNGPVSTPRALTDFFGLTASEISLDDIELRNRASRAARAVTAAVAPATGQSTWKMSPVDSTGSTESSDPEINSCLSASPPARMRSFFDKVPWVRDVIWRPPKPLSVEELVKRVEHHFPLRADLPVQVYDFGDGKTEKHLTRLGNIEEVMFTKPTWVVVRWIHAPLGVGLYHSSVEDIFFKGCGQKLGPDRLPSRYFPRGKVFPNSGRAGWPYLETEIISTRSASAMKDAREAALILNNNPDVQKILNARVFDDDHQGSNTELNDDVEWRARQHLMMEPTFWETAKSDLPYLLSDGALIMKSPAAMKPEVTLSLKKQTLQDHPVYRHAYITRDSFRCFHRGDGFVLSLSPSTGIDYMNIHLPEITRSRCRHLNSYQVNKDKQSDEARFPEQSLSAIAQVYAEFQKDGVRRWHRQRPEWLAVYLMTEIAITPHSIRSGYSIPTILDAYDSIVSKLIERKFESWKRNETAKLVLDYLKAIDELRALGQTYRQKKTFLTRLYKDCKEMEDKLKQEEEEREDGGDKTDPDPDKALTMLGRVEFAMSAVQDLSSQCDQLTKELTASLTSLFQLRSIEQNDRGISADSQGKAILIFTFVTVIFSPLSFMTSYFGMNVIGLADEPAIITQKHFWEVCGTLTTFIVACVIFYLWAVRSYPHTGIPEPVVRM